MLLVSLVPQAFAAYLKQTNKVRAARSWWCMWGLQPAAAAVQTCCAACGAAMIRATRGCSAACAQPINWMEPPRRPRCTVLPPAHVVPRMPADCPRPASPVAVLQVQLPQYVDYVKTGAFKELSPLDPDWYYTRAGARCWLLLLPCLAAFVPAGCWCWRGWPAAAPAACPASLCRVSSRQDPARAQQPAGRHVCSNRRSSAAAEEGAAVGGQHAGTSCRLTSHHTARGCGSLRRQPCCGAPVEQQDAGAAGAAVAGRASRPHL